MVRLVFRPFTQLRRSICTSESLRSSIRVSPDFEFSPCFPGAQRTMRIQQNVYGNLYSQAVTHPSTNRSPYMLDSLVRVSRRVAASADLLCREWPTATARLLAIQVCHDCPLAPKPGHQELSPPTTGSLNFILGLRSGTNGSYSNNV